MKVKVGDQVKILAGKDRNKEGKIIKTLKNENKVVVEGINIIKKHVKPRYTNESGSIVTMEAPIHVSNVKKVEAKKATAKKKEGPPALSARYTVSLSRQTRHSPLLPGR